MSAVSSWANTAKATVWPLVGLDPWTQRPTYGAPQVFGCDYSAESKRETDATGIEFVAKQTIYTELSTIKQGDRVLIGASVATDPLAAGAIEVRMVRRDADTFDRKADDYRVVC